MGKIKSKSAAIEGMRDLLSGVSPLRIFGAGLYNTWILSVFYNDYLYMAATDLRGTMYLSLFISLAALLLTLLLAPRLMPRPDKMVLSKKVIFASGVAMALSTVALCCCDVATTLEDMTDENR